MSSDPLRVPPPARTSQDPALRELLTFLRDVCREAAHRIDRYLDAGGTTDGTHRHSETRELRPREPQAVEPMPTVDVEPVRLALEILRDEARALSNDCARMDPSEMRLRIEAITAETRMLQARTADGECQEVAARILRTLTAIVGERRPGHVYGLARHHHADWEEISHKARAGIEALSRPRPEIVDPTVGSGFEATQPPGRIDSRSSSG